jgi:hypothetical protein
VRTAVDSDRDDHGCATWQEFVTANSSIVAEVSGPCLWTKCDRTLRYRNLNNVTL